MASWSSLASHNHGAARGNGSLWTPLTIGISCSVLLLTYAAFPSAQERAVWQLPTPKTTLPVFRNTLDVMFKHGRRLVDWLLEESRRHNGKPWRMQILGRPVSVVLCSVEAYEDVLKTQFDKFDKGYYTNHVLEDVIGEGIFSTDGIKWLHQRKTASHLFSLQMMRDCMEVSVREHTERLCRRLDQAVATNDLVDFKRVLDLFTMDVFTKIGFGVELHGIETDSNHAFLDAFDRSTQNMIVRLQQPMFSWKLKKWLNIGPEKQLKKDMKVVNDLVMEIIQRSMADQESGYERQKNLISLFLSRKIECANGEQVTPDAKMIRDMTVTFIGAGRDTTSQSISWCLLMLNRYPQTLGKIRQELSEKLPRLMQPDIALEDLPPSMEEVQDLPYLEAVIKETMRLYPVAAITTRTANTDTFLYDGTFVKAGTRIVMSSYALARMHNVWGSDAEEFKPERWIDPETGKVIQVSAFKYPVFLAGPRQCLGMKFALMEMKIALATLLTRFNLRLQRDPFAVTYRHSLTLGIRGDFLFRVTHRV